MLAFIKRLSRQTKVAKSVRSPLGAEESLSILTSRKYVLKALMESLKRENVIGVYATALGDGMFLTAVDEIIDENSDKIIGFKRYDASGHILPRTHFALNEIQAVCPLNARYVNPYLSH